MLFHQKIAVFASGAGSNAQKIIEFFSGKQISVTLVVSNNPKSGVLEIARKHQIATLLIEKEQFFKGNAYVDELKEAGVQFIVLAGFLWKIPPALIQAFPHCIINIHPALLPKYGGKGMYGHLVHEAVIKNREKESGITIHYVDEVYDHGKIIFQATCPVLSDDDAASLANRIHLLEHEYYPQIIKELLHNSK
ncbi:MAG TPA: phosphoribosylglycinamide formyltransferase [Chitinophagaceae bacterium]|jgi:phosphoribosylglycinamide formyltransferase-1|nr:phosphoribosylglycinamide formyltransferase [Chitinophagaceae bacterium]